MNDQFISATASPIFPGNCLGPHYSVHSFSSHRQFHDWLAHNAWMTDEAQAVRIAATALREGISSAWLGNVAADDIECAGHNYRECLMARNLNSRQRAVLDLLAAATAGRAPGGLDVYATEALGQFALHLRQRFSRFVGSEYVPDIQKRAAIAPVKHQDLNQLTFADASFDIALSNDVLEHVPDLGRALSELRRILRQNGLLLATFPFLSRSETTLIKARASRTGSIEFIGEPEYHENPLDPRGALVFQIPGWDICEMGRRAGFAQCEQIVIASERAGLASAEGPGLFVFAARA